MPSLNIRTPRLLILAAALSVAACPRNNTGTEETGSTSSGGTGDGGQMQASSGGSGGASGAGSNGGSGAGSNGGSGAGSTGGSGAGSTGGSGAGSNGGSSAGSNGGSGAGSNGGASSAGGSNGGSGATSASSGGAASGSGAASGASGAAGSSGGAGSGASSGAAASGGASSSTTGGASAGASSSSTSGGVGASSSAAAAGSSSSTTGGAAGSSSSTTGGAASSSSSAGGAASSSSSATSSPASSSSSSSSSSGALMQTYADFCAGNGSIGSFGTTGQTVCSGQLAEETFQFALCACNTIITSSRLDVDSFDSARGPYAFNPRDGGPVNIGDKGDIGVNSMDGGTFVVNSTLTVRGSGYVSGVGVKIANQSSFSRNLTAYGAAERFSSTNVSIGRNAFIHGEVQAGYSVAGELVVPPGYPVAGTYGSLVRADFPDNKPCPCGATEILPIGRLVDYAMMNNDNAVYMDTTRTGLDPDLWATGTGPSDITLPCGRFFVRGIEAGTFNMRISGRVALMIMGDFHTGQLTISVDPGAELDLFVDGSLVSDASADFGSQTMPSSVRAYVTGDVVANGSVTYAGNVYAPNANVEIKNSDFWGALFAKNVTFSARSYVHYDSAVRRAGDVCQPDAGMPPPPDAGTPPPPDAGTPPPPDAGTPPPPDAGMGTPDAGKPCTSVCDGTCGTYACLPSGTGDYMCGACYFDTDCCGVLTCDRLLGICRDSG